MSLNKLILIFKIPTNLIEVIMKKLILLSFLFLAPYYSIAQNNKVNPEITAGEIQDHINYIASDELEGRFAGSKGAELAGEYIKNEFQSYGLMPFFGNDYFQKFDFIEDVFLTKNNSVEIEAGGKKYPLKLNDDFITAPFSDNMNIKAGVVFAGYGISAPKLNYDDYEGIDVKDKIVMVMRYHPEYDSSKSEFDNFSSFRQKTAVAKEKGAIGIIFVNGLKPDDEEDKLMEFRYDRGPAVKEIAAVHIKRKFAEELLKGKNINFAEYQAAITDSKKPASFEINNVHASINTEVKEIESIGRNVAGWLEGNDPALKKEFIVIGGHYDHLGWGKHGSLYRGETPMIHNGADDNASGTTGVLELAEKFSAVKDKLKRSMIFVTFSAEELGLLGSTYFVNNSPVDLDNIAAMLNMDMIGRLNAEKTLNVIGAGTSSIWKDILEKNNKYGFNMSYTDDGFGGSDHQSFTNRQIPVLFFFTGTHPDYHKPSDDADKINSQGEEDIVKYVYDVALELNSYDKRPDYIAVKREESRGGMRSRVYVGTVPEFGYQGDGFKMSGVSEGSPAQKAGLQGGDIMIKFGKKDIANIYDYMYAMGEYSPGDTVDVVVMREGEEVTASVTLGTR